MSIKILLKGLLEIPVDIDSYNPGCAPVTHLLPEDCYPGEAAEVEYTPQVKDISHEDLIKFVEDLIEEDEEEFTDMVLEAADQDAIDSHEAYEESKAEQQMEDRYL